MDRAAVPSAANRRRRTPRPSMKWQKTRSPFAFSSPRPLRLTLYSRRGANSDGDRFATPRRKMGVTAVWALASRTVRKWEDSGELIPKWAQRRRRALLRHGQNPRATEVSPRRQKHRLELVSCIDSIRAPTRPSRIGIGRSAFADGSGPGQNRAFKDAVALMTARRVARSPMDFHFSSYITGHRSPSRAVRHAVLRFEDLNGD